MLHHSDYLEIKCWKHWALCCSFSSSRAWAPCCSSSACSFTKPTSSSVTSSPYRKGSNSDASQVGLRCSAQVRAEERALPNVRFLQHRLVPCAHDLRDAAHLIGLLHHVHVRRARWAVQQVRRLIACLKNVFSGQCHCAKGCSMPKR